MKRTSVEIARDRRARGLCCSCNEPAEPGFTRCPEHRRKFAAYCKKRSADRKKDTAQTTRAAFDAAAYAKQQYEERKAEGLCVGCGNEPAMAESVYGEECLNKQRARQKAAAKQKAEEEKATRQRLRAERKAAGQCLDCGAAERFEQSKFRCPRCLSLYLIHVKGWTRHDARRYVDLCTSCPRKIQPGTVRCQRCHTKQRKRRAKCVLACVCVVHPDRPAVLGRRRCEECRDLFKKKRQDRLAAGMCPECGKNPPTAPNKICDRCLADGRIKDKRRRVKLKRQALEHYGKDALRCFCCHEGNPDLLELDHINGDGASHRRSIGGKNSIGGPRFYAWLKHNGYPPGLQLACATCNRAKHRFGTCPHQKLRADLLQALRDLNRELADAVRLELLASTE